MKLVIGDWACQSPMTWEGWPRHQEEVATPPLTDRTRWSSAARKRWLAKLARSLKRWNLFSRTHSETLRQSEPPICPAAVASPFFLDGAAPHLHQDGARVSPPETNAGQKPRPYRSCFPHSEVYRPHLQMRLHEFCRPPRSTWNKRPYSLDWPRRFDHRERSPVCQAKSEFSEAAQASNWLSLESWPRNAGKRVVPKKRVQVAPFFGERHWVGDQRWTSPDRFRDDPVPRGTVSGSCSTWNHCRVAKPWEKS
jgi:hypothetical protein